MSKTKKIAKHVWKRKNWYGHAIGSAVSFGAGVGFGIKTYGRAINYNPTTERQLRKIKKDQQTFIKRHRQAMRNKK